ncbi:MAG: carboxypeptidase regulatory-like domain-containing protein [bacterium]|nr:carboxypeptidase regulatory-like domain-containing protein [bacterium]
MHKKYIVKGKKVKNHTIVNAISTIFLVVLFVFFAQPTMAAIVTWDGGGTDGTCGGGPSDGNKGSCGLNWSTDSVPTSADVITFDATSTKDINFDGATNVLGVDINTGYTGTLTQNAAITVGASGFDIADGTFAGGSQTIDINGFLIQSGGSFTSTSGILYLNNDWTVSGGSFAHNNGGIELDNSTFNLDIDVLTSLTLYDLRINGTTNTVEVQVAVDDTLIVTNTLLLTNGEFDTGTIEAQSGITHTATFDGGAGTINVTGPLAFSPIVGGVLPGMKFSHVGSSFTGLGSGTTIFEGKISMVAGTFNNGAGTISTARGLDVASAATYNHDGGTFIVTSGLSNNPWDLDGQTITFNNFTQSGYIKTGAADVINVNGLLSLTNGDFVDGTIQQNGTFSFTSGHDGGTGVIHFNTLQNINLLSNGELPGASLNVSGSSITGIGAGLTAGLEGDVTLTNGTTLNAGAGTFQLGGDFDLQAGATFNHNSGTVQLVNDDLITWQFTGNIVFFNLEKKVQNNGSPSIDAQIIFPAGQTTVIDGNLDIFGSIGIFPLVDIVLRSNSAGSQATLDVNGSVNRLSYVDIKDIIVDNPATAYCVVECTDSGNNTNIYFGDPGIIVSNISGNTTEAGGTATFSVVLRNKPSANVSVALASTDTGEGTVSTPSLTFTNGNWGTSQTVTVTGQDDSDDDGGIEYTVTVGPGTSADAAYSGLEARDLTVINEDNDTATNAINFEDNANFTREDVSDSLGITTWSHYYYGHLELNTDIRDSVIRAGCKINLDGTEYIISRVWENEANGMITVTDDPATSPEILDTTLGALPGVVNSIYCTDIQSTGLALSTDDFISTDSIYSAAENPIYYDSTNNVIWVYNGNIDRVDLTTRTFSTITTSASFTGDIAFDPGRDRFWVTNNSLDSITAFEMSTGNPAFGTLGASTFVSNDRPNGIVYDSVNDKLWVATPGLSDVVTVHNPADGSITNTIAMVPTDNFGTRGITYDSVNDIVWLVQENSLSLLAIDGSTETYVNGTLANSTFSITPPDTDFASGKPPIYTPTSDSVWVMNAQCEPGIFNDYIHKVDATSGRELGHYPVRDCPTQITYDATNKRIFSTSDHDGSFSELREKDGTLVESHAGMDSSNGIAVDAEDDIWITQYATALHEYVRDGVPVNEYYTTITTDPNQIDVSSEAAIGSAVVDETLNNQSLFYTLSFDDRASFKVWGSWRTIASSSVADHGGVDGNWYWRDNANAWSAASPNTPEAALSAAIAAGTNNQMDGTTLASLDNADFALSGGFEAGTTQTLDVATTAFSDDPHDAPVVRSIQFLTATPGITVSAISGNTTESGGTATFTVVLNTAPSASVTIPVATSDLTEGNVSTSSLTFTTGNWSTPQTVTVTGVDDSIEDGDITYSIILNTTTSGDAGYNNLNPDDVTVVNEDDDIAPIFAGTISDQTWDEDTVLDNAFDLDDFFTDTTSTGLTYDILSTDEPTNIDVKIAVDGTVDFTPDADWNGTDTITFTATNNIGTTNSNQVSLTINPINDVPEAPLSGFSPQKGDETSDTTPTISWNDATDIDDASSTLTYELRIGTNSDPENNYDYTYNSDTGEPNVDLTTDLTVGEKYYYIVRTIDPQNAQSSWSTVQSFVVSTNEPIINLSKKVGINLALGNESLLTRMVGRILGWPAFAANESYSISPIYDSLIYTWIMSILLTFISFIYAGIHGRHPYKSFRLLIVKAQSSYPDIAKTNQLGMFTTAYSKYRIKTFTAKTLNRVGIIGIIISTVVLSLSSPTLSFTDQSSRPVEPGDKLTYEISITNTGSGDATSSVITESLPDSTSLVSGSISVNGRHIDDNKLSDGSGIIPIGTVSAGQTATLSYSVTINNPVSDGQTDITSPASTFSSNETTAKSNSVKNPIIDSSVGGTIVDDATNVAIENAAITLIDKAGASLARDTSDASGTFLFAGLHSGDYTVVVDGPDNYSNANVAVSPAQSEDLRITIRLTKSESVIVDEELVEKIITGELKIEDLDEAIIDELLEEILEGRLDPDNIPDDLLRLLLERALHLNFINGKPLDLEHPLTIIVPIEFADDDTILELIGRSYPNSTVTIQLCNAGLSSNYEAKANDDGVWEMKIPRDLVNAGLNTIVGEASLNDVISKNIVLGHFVNAAQPPTYTLWLIFINFFILLMTLLSLTFVQWWRGKALTEDELKKKQSWKIFVIFISLVAMIVFAYIIVASLTQDKALQDVSFTSRIEVPELTIASIDDQPVELNTTQVIEAEEKIIIAGTGTPNSHVSINLCSGIEAYGVDIDDNGNWQLELPLNEIPNQNIVYQASLTKDGKIVVPETDLFEIEVTDILAGIPIWLLILLALFFIISAVLFEWNILTLFATRLKIKKENQKKLKKKIEQPIKTISVAKPKSNPQKNDVIQLTSEEEISKEEPAPKPKSNSRSKAATKRAPRKTVSGRKLPKKKN